MKPVLLIIRDGWGENHNSAQDSYNAVKLAKTPIEDQLKKEWPRTEIRTCGLDVGLPKGVMGNSEVGHQNIGAGRIVDQEIVRIDKAMNKGLLKENLVLQKAFENVKKNKSKLHILGLTSNAGVHSVMRHLYNLLKLSKQAGVTEVFIHAFTDGRDSPPKSGMEFLKELEAACKKIGVGKIASVCGRYWAMDRDKRWDRVQKAYDCIVGIKAEFNAKNANEVLLHYYKKPLDETRQGDEFVLPSWIVNDSGNPIGPVEDHDSVIFFNFRGDRPRELTHAFLDEKFDGFKREKRLDVFYVTMTAYEEGLCQNVLFQKPPKMKNILGEFVSAKGIAQFRCAETEKYPHVTFFFNDYRDEPFRGEDRVIVPSQKDVPTYDLKPEMSAPQVCEAVKKALFSKKYGLLVVNFANPDMVGHSGSLTAVIKAVETVDECVGELLEVLDQVGGVALITADHGNAEQMWDLEANAPHTQHTTNSVEVLICGNGCKGLKMKEGGRLADIAPTILKLMGLKQPKEMTGESLIVKCC